MKKIELKDPITIEINTADFSKRSHWADAKDKTFFRRSGDGYEFGSSGTITGAITFPHNIPVEKCNKYKRYSAIVKSGEIEGIPESDENTFATNDGIILITQVINKTRKLYSIYDLFAVDESEDNNFSNIVQDDYNDILRPFSENNTYLYSIREGVMNKSFIGYINESKKNFEFKPEIQWITNEGNKKIYHYFSNAILHGEQDEYGFFISETEPTKINYITLPFKQNYRIEILRGKITDVQLKFTDSDDEAILFECIKNENSIDIHIDPSVNSSFEGILQNMSPVKMFLSYPEYNSNNKEDETNSKTYFTIF